MRVLALIIAGVLVACTSSPQETGPGISGSSTPPVQVEPTADAGKDSTDRHVARQNVLRNTYYFSDTRRW